MVIIFDFDSFCSKRMKECPAQKCLQLWHSHPNMTGEFFGTSPPIFVYGRRSFSTRELSTPGPPKYIVYLSILRRHETWVTSLQFFWASVTSYSTTSRCSMVPLLHNVEAPRMTCTPRCRRQHHRRWVIFLSNKSNITKWGVSLNGGTPKWLVLSWKSLLKWMIWGENPPFKETPKYLRRDSPGEDRRWCIGTTARDLGGHLVLMISMKHCESILKACFLLGVLHLSSITCFFKESSCLQLRTSGRIHVKTWTLLAMFRCIHIHMGDS